MQLFDPGDLGLREAVERELLQRRPAPERERLVQRHERQGRVGSGARLVDELLESMQVELSRFETQKIAGRTGDDQPVHAAAPSRLERAAQVRDVRVKDVRG